jgi:hypothetical protein
MLTASSLIVITLEAFAALALTRRGGFPFLAAFVWYLGATDALGFALNAMHKPHDPTYALYFRAVTAGQLAGMLAVTWEAQKPTAAAIVLALLGTVAFALGTGHPHTLKLEAWFAALSWTGAFCGLYLLLGKRFGVLMAYMALHAVLYSTNRESLAHGQVGLALNIGVGCCMVGWLLRKLPDASGRA